MKKVIIGALSISAAIASAATAQAQVAYMSGLFGATPNYASIVAPAGQGCNPKAGCTQIKYNNVSVASGATAIANWIATHPGQNTIWTYSATTDSVIQYLNAHPEDTTTQFYLLGSPSTPGDATLNVQKLPTGHYNVTFVVRQYDIAADKPAGTANNARGNLSQSIHLNGYNNLNLTAPAITWTDPRTGSVTEYFLTYPLPEISTAFKTAAQIAAEDRAKRPGVESQYYLPGKVQRPVVLPAPVYPATAVATTVSTPVATAAVSGGTPVSDSGVAATASEATPVSDSGGTAAVSGGTSVSDSGGTAAASGATSVSDSGGTAAVSGGTSVSDSGGTAAVSGGTSVSDSGGTAATNDDSDRHTTVTHDRAHRQQSPQHNRRGHKNS